MDDLETTIRRNMLLGMWAAEDWASWARTPRPMLRHWLWARWISSSATCSAKFARTSRPRAWSDRDEQILRAMNQLMLEAGGQMQGREGNSPDAAAVMIARIHVR